MNRGTIKINNKILILVRHGRAIDGEIFPGEDFDRPLLEDGKKEFKALAHFLKEKISLTPEIILTSSARRCFETAEILQESYKLDISKFISTQNLYYGYGELGKIENYFEELMKTEEKINIVALVGHNWIITDFASELIGESCASMKKGSVIILKLKDKINRENITRKSCNLVAYMTPQLIK